MSNRCNAWQHRMRRLWPHIGLLVLCGSGTVLLGCGSKEPMARMSGTVTYQGAPVEEGLLVLSNPQQGVYITAEILQGAYEIKTSKQGVPPGNYRVAITPALDDHPVGPILQPPKPAAHANIPPRYRDEETSGFTVQLNEGDNLADFDMTK